MIEFSIVIPNYNSERTIEKCVKSVLASDKDNFEVIVVDDKSTDASLKILERIKNKKLKIIKNKKNSGASFSRNNGIRNAKGDIIILLDSDTYVDRGWLHEHYRSHKEIDADIIGGGIIGLHKTIWGKCDSYCNWWTAIPNHKSYFLKKLHLPTNNLSIKKKVFKKIGYFDENLPLGGEDAEFCFRALKKGLRIYFKSDLTIFHYDRETLKDFINAQKNWGRHAVKMRKKLKMDYNYLMPNSYAIAYLYIIPLAFLYTSFIISKWIGCEAKVIFYLPLIFLGKLKQSIEIKNSLRSSRSNPNSCDIQ